MSCNLFLVPGLPCSKSGPKSITQLIIRPIRTTNGHCNPLQRVRHLTKPLEIPKTPLTLGDTKIFLDTCSTKRSAIPVARTIEMTSVGPDLMPTYGSTIQNQRKKSMHDDKPKSNDYRRHIATPTNEPLLSQHTRREYDATSKFQFIKAEL